MKIYTINQINNNLMAEAGVKQNILMAILSIMSTTSAYYESKAIRNYLNSKNIPEQTIMEIVGKPQQPIENLTQNDVNNALNISAPIPENTQNINENNEDIEKNVNQDIDLSYINQLSPDEIILLRTIYDEAEGESIDGKIAVASVLFKRGKGSIPNMAKEAIKYKQFSGWNDNKIPYVPQLDKKDKTGSPKENKALYEVLRIIKALKDGNFKPIAGNFDHFYNPNHPKFITITDHPDFAFYPHKTKKDGKIIYVYPKTPENYRKDGTKIGNHVFYNLGYK